MSLFAAVNDLEERSTHLGMFELGVLPLEPDDEGSSGGSFVLVGVDKSHSEATELFEEWRSDWESELTFVGCEEMGMIPDVMVYEFE